MEHCGVLWLRAKGILHVAYSFAVTIRRRRPCGREEGSSVPEIVEPDLAGDSLNLSAMKPP